MKTIQALMRVSRCLITLLEAGYAVQPLSVQHGGGL